MFQLKLCLKIFETSSLMYVSALKCIILAIILVPVIRSKCKRAQIVQGDEKNSRGAAAPYFRAYGKK